MAETDEKREVGIAGLPLRRVEYKAVVRGFEAQVTVEQHFGNDLDHPVEAIYVFPLPAESKVLGVEMTIGDRTVQAELRKREDAQREYEEARDAGHHAALVEQERENIFTVSVGGIEPGEQVSVRSRYMMPVPYQAGGGRFSMPLVVAPRFIPGIAKEGGGTLVPDAERITPKLVASVPYTASIELALAPGFPARVESPSHDSVFEACDLAANESRTFRADNLRPDRDVIFTYTTTVPFPSLIVDHTKFEKDGKEEHFAVVQVTPGVRATSPRTRYVMFLLDHSGSMDGAKQAGLKIIVKKALGRLVESNEPTQVGIMMFDHGVDLLVPFATIGEAHAKKVDSIPHGGNTLLGTALTAAMQAFKKVDADVECCIILVCDGQSEDRAFAETPGVRVHCIGIDAAVNDELLCEIVRKTGGAFESVFPGEDYDGVAARMVELASGPVVRDLKLDDLPDGAEVVGLGDLYAARPRTIVVRMPRFAACFKVQGRGVDGTKHKWTIDVPHETTSPLGALLWAKMQMRATHDREEQTALSLRYGLVCASTAFVAVSQKQKPGEKPVRVDIPVLLPHTWEYDDMPFAAGAGLCRRAAVASVQVNCLMLMDDGPRAAGLAGGTFDRGIGLGAPARRRVTGGIGSVIVGAAKTAKDAVAGFFGGGDDDADGTAGSPQSAESAFMGDPDDVHLPPPPPRASNEMLYNVESLLALLKAGELNRSDADWQWKLLMQELINQDQCSFAGWDETERAQLFEYLVALRAFGYKVKIPQTLEVEPQNPAARISWVRARQSLGIAESSRP